MTDETYRLRRIARLAETEGSLLDLGCAQIPNTNLRAGKVVGMDLSPFSAPATYDEVVVGDVMRLPSPFEPESFDVVVAGELLEHVEEPFDLLRGIFSVLRPSGRVVLSTPNPNSPWERLLTIPLSRRFFYTQEHVMLFPQRWLIRMAERVGFVGVELLSGGIQIPGFRLVPFPRPWCYQTILRAHKPIE